MKYLKATDRKQTFGGEAGFEGSGLDELRKEMEIPRQGRLMTCEAIHNSAEINSLMVRVGTKERDRLLKEQPEVYYLTDHYRPYDAILVRLSKVDDESLRELLESSWRFVREAA